MRKTGALRTSRAAPLILPLLAGIAPPTAVSAAMLPVTNCNDSGSGSLRAALAIAQSGDTVDMSALTCSKISVQESALQISSNDLVLKGPGANALTIGVDYAPSYLQNFSVFHHTGVGTLRIDALRITHHGHITLPSANYYSGTECITSSGNVDLNRSIVTECGTGGVSSNGFSANYSTISNNAQGGVAVLYGGASIRNSTISGNTGGTCAALSLGNNFANHGTVVISNSTISGNTALHAPEAGTASHAAVCIDQMNSVTISNSTIVFNHIDFSGTGGVEIGLLGGGTVTLESSIIAGNTSGDIASDLSVNGAELVGHNNLIRAATSVPADTISADPLLLPLADNGGPTFTHALAEGSPAIDAGNNVANLPFDQRGAPFARVFGAHADIGAFELQPVRIDASFTGSWYDPDQSGQGLMLEVLPGGNLLALWFSFGPTGQQAWFGGVGSYSGNSAVIDSVSLPTGGKWVSNFDTSVAQNPWGALTFTFSDRDHGRIDFSSSLGYGTGTMKLTRLTRIASTPPSAVASPIGPPVAVVPDPYGNLYFSSAPDRVFKVDAQGGLTNVAGTGTAGFSGDGGPATRAQLNFPLSYPELVHDPADFTPLVGGLARDAAGNLFIADAYNNRVRRIDTNGIISTVAGDGYSGNSGGAGLATLSHLYWPQGVGLDAAGNLYVTSAFGPLFEVTLDGFLHPLSGSNCGPGYLGPGLCAPSGISVDSVGNLFVPDGYCRVREIRPGGTFVTVAGADKDPSGGAVFTCGYSGDGGPATKAALSYPYGVAVDKVGTLYIADTGNSCIRRVSTAGIITTFAGVCDTDATHGGYAGDGGPATQARLNQPFGVAVDNAGNVYIADTYNNRVRKVSGSGIITTIAGNGAALTTPTAAAIGPAFTGNWYNPSQSGHGLMLEVLPDNQLLALWFAFSPTGEQSWFGGVGSYSGNSATITGAALPTGGKWIPNFDPHALTANVWGTLTFTFSDCNHGKVDYSSTYDGYGSGSLELTRLTLPAGLTCP